MAAVRISAHSIKLPAHVGVATVMNKGRRRTDATRALCIFSHTAESHATSGRLNHTPCVHSDINEIERNRRVTTVVTLRSIIVILEYVHLSVAYTITVAFFVRYTLCARCTCTLCTK